MIKIFELAKEERRIKKLLSNKKEFGIEFPGQSSNNGWTISILGKSLEDSIDLWKRLHDYLLQKDIAHEFSTLKRIKHKNKEQSSKLLTIYIPDGLSINQIAPELQKKLQGYKSWQDVKTPSDCEHWGNAIFFRKGGNYIKSQNRDLYL